MNKLSQNNLRKTSTSVIQEYLLHWWEKRGKNAFNLETLEDTKFSNILFTLNIL